MVLEVEANSGDALFDCHNHWRPAAVPSIPASYAALFSRGCLKPFLISCCFLRHLRVALSPQPFHSQSKPVKVEVHHRRGVEGKQLTEDQAADDGYAEGATK